MLGIIIGIASVVSVVALGQGSQQTVLDRISSIGTNTINVLPGASAADRRRDAIRTLVPADAAAIAAESYADSVTPQVSSNGTVRYRSVSANAQIQGVGSDYFRVNNRSFVDGTTFDADSVSALAQEAVIDTTARDTLFTNGEEAVGQVVLVGNVPLRIIGVVAASSNNFGPQSNAISIWMPYTTAMSRILGQSWLSSITVRIADSADVTEAQGEIEALLNQRHSTTDFSLQNTDTIRETIQSTSQTLSLLISAIAVISLIVGGIGVMNIMLVSVRERTREIGVRMAVGARQGDIMQQFLIEAVLVCLIGGTIGVLLSLGIGFGVEKLVSGMSFIYSPSTIAAAFVASTIIGVGFGFMPARAAARLDPVVALASE
jgi:macrolide transport system ATP-binding/permease protein